MDINAQSGEVIVTQGSSVFGTLHWTRAMGVVIDIDQARTSIMATRPNRTIVADYAEIRVLACGRSYSFTLEEFLQRLGIDGGGIACTTG